MREAFAQAVRQAETEVKVPPLTGDMQRLSVTVQEALDEAVRGTEAQAQEEDL